MLLCQEASQLGVWQVSDCGAKRGPGASTCGGHPTAMRRCIAVGKQKAPRAILINPPTNSNPVLARVTGVSHGVSQVRVKVKRFAA